MSLQFTPPPPRHGVQGQMNRASKAQLENQFDSTKDDDCVKHILEKGDVQEHKVSLNVPSTVALSRTVHDYGPPQG